MPKNPAAYSKGNVANAVPALLNAINRGSGCTIPVICRMLSYEVRVKNAVALERSWRKWVDRRSGKVTLPDMQTLGEIIRVSRSRGWLETKLPANQQALVEAVEHYSGEIRERWRLKVMRHMRKSLAELGELNFKKAGNFDFVVEGVLMACCDSLAENFPNYWEAEDLNATQKLQRSVDSGMHYMNSKFAEAIDLIRNRQQETQEYFRLIASGEMIGEDVTDEVEGDQATTIQGFGPPQTTHSKFLAPTATPAVPFRKKSSKI